MKTLPSIEQTADKNDAELDAKSFAQLPPAAPSKVHSPSSDDVSDLLTAKSQPRFAFKRPPLFQVFDALDNARKST